MTRSDSVQSKHLELRDHMVAALRRELIGPSESEEVLSFDGPRQRYGAGILFPLKLESQTGLGADESSNEANETDNDTGAGAERGIGNLKPKSEDDGSALVDGEINLANEFMPSVMGLTVLADVTANLEIHFDYATYKNLHVQENGRDVKAWKRVPLSAGTPPEVFKSSELGATNEPSILKRKLQGPDENGVELRVFIRGPGPKTDPNLRLVTVSLVNRASDNAPGGLDAACIYQVSLKLKSERQDGFRPLPERDAKELCDEESLSQALLYQKISTFAVGHGVAPDWSGNDPHGTYCVYTSTVPEFDIAPIVPTSRPFGKELSMRALADPNEYGVKGAANALCRSLIEDYSTWIGQQELDAQKISDPHLRKTAERHLGVCRNCLDRMKRGLEILADNSNASFVFARMNEAILAQQIRYGQVAENTREWTASAGNKLHPESPPPNPELNVEKRAWRPFQLAFILMSISSIVLQDDDAFKERDLVDVIWFPTGGGKTEAYLGLTAFTIFWRRISDPSAGSGTAVLMRYTLRLLTAQQFERASTLICALEQIRKKERASFGDEPISIGLWVGQGLSPNTDADAVKSLRDLQSKQNAPNRFVLTKCPWCGAKMGVVSEKPRAIRGLRHLSKPSRIELHCDAPDCEFSEEGGLPIFVVDERIYEKRPSLIIGTVDKFAMLPWREQSTVGRIFGADQNGPNPPTLVIQDELHLIAGPLGSMTGHYETLVDELCRTEFDGRRIGAKIVGSTATISRASEQVAALYGREPEDAVLFPPQALEAGNSFFAEERVDLPGRRYVGVFATALPSFVTTEVRVLAALLQAPKLFEHDDISELDAFWTLVTYFNSIRELGHAATLVDQDIREYLTVMARRLNLLKAESDEAFNKRRWINNPLELTSRISNEQVTNAISQLFKKNSDDDVIDICLATNMIQVGIDVSRLGLMAVVGQPKTTAEYIQATSRVGRSEPGLVVAMLNPGKPRDRSHYEHFRSFHEAIYRNVEPTSVTPFALPVRDRALHALIVGLARLVHGHQDSSVPPPKGMQRNIEQTIIDRVAVVDRDEIEQTRMAIQKYFALWEETGPASWGTPMTPHPDVHPLMFPAGSNPREDWTDFARPTAMSMRNVDTECGVQVASLDTD